MGNRARVATSCATIEPVRPKAGKAEVLYIGANRRERGAETLPTYGRGYIPCGERCDSSTADRFDPLDRFAWRCANKATLTISSRNRPITAARLIYVTVSVSFADARRLREEERMGDWKPGRDEALLSYSGCRKMFNCRFLCFRDSRREKVMGREERITVSTVFPGFYLVEKMRVAVFIYDMPRFPFRFVELFAIHSDASVIF